jgi:hypothetical protein
MRQVLKSLNDLQEIMLHTAKNAKNLKALQVAHFLRTPKYLLKISSLFCGCGHPMPV